MTYVRPMDVSAPRGSWQLSDVLIDRGKNSNRYSSEAWSLARGRWCGVPCLGIRLNGSAASLEGYPIGFGEPVWFILPTEFNTLALPLVPADKRPKNVSCRQERTGLLGLRQAPTTLECGDFRRRCFRRESAGGLRAF
jgi:hypothetical protein